MRLELNSLISSSPISTVFDKVQRLECKIFVIKPDATAPGELHILPYRFRLYKYALEHLVAHYVKKVNDEYHVYLISSSREPISYFVEELDKHKIALSKEKVLEGQRVEEFVQGHKQLLAESYLRLALREYLLRKGYSVGHVGGRTLWSKGDSNYLYVIDVDVDPEMLKGYVSVDFRLYSSSSIWDKITGGTLSEDTLWELVDTPVLVPYGKRLAYGRISNFVKKRVSENIETKRGLLNLVEYYAKKGVSIDPEEYPVVEVRLISPELEEPLYYPPSKVRLLIPIGKPEPHTRYEEINRVLKDVSSGFKPFGIAFKPVLVTQPGFVDMIKNIKLRCGNLETHKSPLISAQRENATPLRGRINIPVLVLLLPRELSSRENYVNALGRFLQKLYEAYNMGKIGCVELYYYDEKPSAPEQKVEFSRALGRIVNKYSPVEAIIVPVINHRYLFSVAKQICSDKLFHARVLQLDTLLRILSGVEEFVLSRSLESLDHSIEYFIKEVRSRGPSDEWEKRFLSEVSNVLFSIYVEFVIQSEVFNRRIPQTLTWSLAEPSDGEGRTLYLGYDVSRNPLNRNEIAAIFILYDSYGNMVNATVRRYPGERVSREFLESVLLSLVAHQVGDRYVDRLVFYKDGFIRSTDEAISLSEALQSIGARAGFNEFDIVGVVKRHNLRLFQVKTPSRVINPGRGTWVKLWSVSRYGVIARRALVVSSEARAGGTVKPVVIEHYNISRSGRGVEDIVSEYLRLCRLNFWNPIDGINKYPLPVFMADKLAYLSLIGVEIKTP